MLITQKVEHYEVQINKQNANAVERDEKLLPQYVNIKKNSFIISRARECIEQAFLYPHCATFKQLVSQSVPHVYSIIGRLNII